MELYIRFSSLIEIDRSLYGTCVMPSVRKVLMAGLFKTIGTEKKNIKRLNISKSNCKCQIGYPLRVKPRVFQVGILKRNPQQVTNLSEPSHCIN